MSSAASTFIRRNYCGHSADVSIHLEVAGIAHRVIELAPEYLVVAEALAIPPDEGKVILQIDSAVTEFAVRFKANLTGTQWEFEG